MEPSVVGQTYNTHFYNTAPALQVEKRVDTHVTNLVPQIASKSVETQVYQSVPTLTKTVQTETFGPAEPSLVRVEHVEKVKTRVTPKKQKVRFIYQNIKIIL